MGEIEIIKPEQRLLLEEFQKNTFKLGLFLWNPGANERKPLPNLSNLPNSMPLPENMNLDTNTLINTALSRRPEIKALQYQQDITKVELQLARNQLMPGVNADIYQGADTGYQGIGYIMKGSVTFDMPLRLRTAKGKVQGAKIKLEKLGYELKLLQQRIELEIMDIVSNINALQQRFEAATEEVKQLRILEKGERDRYSLGDSTLFVVNRRERDRVEAENKLIDLHAEYLQSLALLKAATATL